MYNLLLWNNVRKFDKNAIKWENLVLTIEYYKGNNNKKNIDMNWACTTERSNDDENCNWIRP